jgi:hypothetical protein
MLNLVEMEKGLVKPSIIFWTRLISCAFTIFSKHAAFSELLSCAILICCCFAPIGALKIQGDPFVERIDGLKSQLLQS